MKSLLVLIMHENKKAMVNVEKLKFHSISPKLSFKICGGNQ